MSLSTAETAPSAVLNVTDTTCVYLCTFSEVLTSTRYAKSLPCPKSAALPDYLDRRIRQRHRAVSLTQVSVSRGDIVGNRTTSLQYIRLFKVPREVT